MEKCFGIYIKSILIFFCLLSPFCSQAIRPVAKSVSDMHELNADFRAFRLFYNAHESVNSAFTNVVTAGTYADLIPAKLFSLVQQGHSAITLEIPYMNSVIVVELVRVNIFSDDFAVTTGENQVSPYTPGVYYRGIINGNSNSVAAFSFFNDELYGVISDDVNNNLVVAPLSFSGNHSHYIIYSDKNLLKSPGNYCQTVDDISVSAKIHSTQLNPSSTTNCVRLYYEVDHDIFLDKGNLTNATNWMTAVHNNVATLYANDNISVALSSIYVWSTNDPYTGANSNDQLDLFRATRPSFNGDAGQLVAHDSNNGGLGYLDALCLNTNYSYADVDYSYSSVPTYSWTIEVITHEFGHILGSAHTHNCNWPPGALDDCYATEGGCPSGPTPVNGGTIMSYCHLSATGINFNNGFGPYPAAAIQTAVNNAGCLGTSCAVCPVPANDACNAPALLPISSNCVYRSGNLCGATESLSPENCGGIIAAHGYDLWYRVNPVVSDLQIKCLSGTNTNAVIALYSGSCTGLTLIDCSNSTGTGGIESIIATVTPGTSYFIRVYDFDGNTIGRDFAICASHSCQPISNDNCANATALSTSLSCNFINGDLCPATESMSPSMCSGYQSDHAYDQWYSITPNQSNVRITVQSGDDADIVLGLFSNTCGALNLIGCNDSTGSGGIEIINASLTPGNTYYVRVYDWSGNLYGTDYQICSQYTSCNPPSAPVNVNATNAIICAGASTNINANGALSTGATWQWYTASCGGTSIGTGAVLSVTPTVTTTYYVRGENGTCYSSCKSVTVTVTPFPAAPSSAGASPSTICSGDASSLTVIGTLSSGASWHWYNSSCGTGASGTGSAISVNPSATATYYVRAENGLCFSSCVNTMLNVNASPSTPSSISSSTTTICSGESVLLTVNGTLSSGATWKWFSNSCGGTSQGTGSTLTVNPTSTTSYHLRAENANCISPCANTVINVNPTPSDPQACSTNASTICQGETASLFVSGILLSGSDWYWYPGNCSGTSIGHGATIPVTPVADETYFVRAQDGACNSSCLSVFINVNIPAASPNITLSFDTLSVPSFSAYQWYMGPNLTMFSPVGTTQQQRAGGDGYYFAVVTDGNGCTVSSDTIMYSDVTGIINPSISDIARFYPNAVTNELSVQLLNGIPGGQIFLFDHTGKLVFQGSLTKNRTCNIPMTYYASGIYQLEIVSGNKAFGTRIFKQ